MGAFLIMSSDHRIAAEGDYRIGMNEVAIGLTVPRFAIEVARQRLTPAYFSRVVMTAEMFGPAEAVTAGFFDRVVPSDQLEKAADETAQALSKLNMAAHAETKARARGAAISLIRQLLDAVATEAYMRLAAIVAKAKTPEDYTAKYVRFALANRALYALMTSRPHATMKHNPPLQKAVHMVITEAMRIFCADIESPVARRRAVMKVYITLYGGISLYATGVLDQPSEKALITELSAMNAGK